MNPFPGKELTRYSPDEMIALYKHDPALFDELAAEALQKMCIGSSPEETLRKQRMQWSIDMRLRKGKTPLERMRIMETIFYGEIFGTDGHMAHLVSHWRDLLQRVHTTAQIPEIPKQKLRLLKR